MSDHKIASSGAAILWEVAMDGNLANVDGVERADRMSATGTPSPVPAILKAYTSKCEPVFFAIPYVIIEETKN